MERTKPLSSFLLQLERRDSIRDKTARGSEDFDSNSVRMVESVYLLQGASTRFSPLIFCRCVTFLVATVQPHVKAIAPTIISLIPIG